MNECVFCNIVTGKVPAKVFYEDGHSLAFASLEPVVDGHVVVIPKRHAVNMLDIDTDDLKALVESTQEVARRVLEVHGGHDFNLLMANGEKAQQSVPHFHWHIVPRFAGDGLDLWIK